MMNNKENINTILRKPKKQPRILSIKPRPFMDKILDKKLNMKDKIRKINKKALIPAIKSIIAVSFKKPDKTIFIDDRLDNIQASQKLNFKTIHLTDPYKIKEQINELIL